MNNKVLFICSSLAIGLTLLFVAGKFNVHHTILRAALPYNCSQFQLKHFVQKKDCPEVAEKKDCPQLSCPSPTPNTKPVPYLDTKKELSKKLAETYLELQNAMSHKTPPTPKLLLQLKGIIGNLDPAFKISQDEKELVDPKPTDKLVDACPEKYIGEKFGYPYYHKGWQLQNCTNVKPLHQVVSIALNTMEYPEPMEKQVDTVLRGINQTYPKVKVFLAAKTSQIEAAAKKYPNIKIVSITKGSSLGKVWNQVLNEVSTPYTLVARDVVHFNWVARIERQIRIISTTGHVVIAGGSYRNLSGHWWVGCRQTKLKNYVLQYEEGYHYSKHSCMFCDDLEGPFVAKTDFLKKLKFSEKYSKEVVFEEFFLRASQSGNLIMNCPDVMYYTTDYSTQSKRNSKAVWRPLATDIKLVRVVLLDYGVRHAFSCGEISYKCSPGVTKYVALPMCCLEQYGNAIKFFHDMCMRDNIHFELDAGSNLAAVKFNNYSPFDLDGDMIVSAWNMSKLKANQGYIAQHGFSITGYKPAVFNSKGEPTDKGYAYYNSPDIYTEVWGYASMSAYRFSPPELNKLPLFTKCRVNNHWINCVHFPGLFTRNRYGPDVLKHSQSWLQVAGMKDSWGRYKPGGFLSCNNPTFHSCLDKFPGDGNIPFKVL